MRRRQVVNDRSRQREMRYEKGSRNTITSLLRLIRMSVFVFLLPKQSLI